MTVREVIMACCKEKKISLSDLAEMAGMNQSSLSRAISRGRDGGQFATEGSGMRVDTLLKLLEILDAEVFVETVHDQFTLDGCSEIDEDDTGVAFPDM